MHNESGNLELLFRRPRTSLRRIGLPYEIICVDDGSTDGTVPGLLAQKTTVHDVRLIKLSRNYGKKKAILAGLHRSRGAATVIMDADLQHPPELLERFVAHWRNGYQVVYGERRSRAQEPASYRWPAQTFYWIFKWLAGVLAVLFLGGGQLLGIGVLGEYVGRIFTEVRQGPSYLVEREYDMQESVGSGLR